MGAYRNWKAHRESHELRVKLLKEAQVYEVVRIENDIRRRIADIFNGVIAVKHIQQGINNLLQLRFDLVERFRNRCATDPVFQDSLFREGFDTFKHEKVNEISFS